MVLAACGGSAAEGSASVVRGDATTTATTVPGAPGIGTATASGVSMIVKYTAPAWNGSLVIKKYTATANPGGITGTVATSTSGQIVVTGLTSGTLYTFTVTATNNSGTSSASSPSMAVKYVMDTSKN
ncbi:MAG: fibronectin type III domain-containing protein [Actinobacteria bacterium]|nr:fibronectin type III domain-containing protein [Actinomycetota bacterium]